jgi:hypothetical protein
LKQKKQKFKARWKPFGEKKLMDRGSEKSASQRLTNDKRFSATFGHSLVFFSSLRPSSRGILELFSFSKNEV